MKNPFQVVDQKKSTIKKQQKLGTQIITKKRGRPPRPNMVKKLVKVDQVLYKQISDKANKEHTSIAAVLTRAMQHELSN